MNTASRGFFGAVPAAVPDLERPGPASAADAALGEHFRRAMRGVPASVFIVATADGDGTPHGLVATSLTSLSMDPPSVLVCVNRASSAHRPIIEAGAFSVTQPAAERADLCAPFATPHGRAARFADRGWSFSAAGLPVHDGARMTLLCRLGPQWRFGTHSVFVGLVDEVRGPGGSETLAQSEALLYADGGYLPAKSGEAGSRRGN